MKFQHVNRTKDQEKIAQEELESKEEQRKKKMQYTEQKNVQLHDEIFVQDEQTKRNALLEQQKLEDAQAVANHNNFLQDKRREEENRVRDRTWEHQKKQFDDAKLVTLAHEKEEEDTAHREQKQRQQNQYFQNQRAEKQKQLRDEHAAMIRQRKENEIKDKQRAEEDEKTAKETADAQKLHDNALLRMSQDVRNKKQNRVRPSSPPDRPVNGHKHRNRQYKQFEDANNSHEEVASDDVPSDDDTQLSHDSGSDGDPYSRINMPSPDLKDANVDRRPQQEIDLERQLKDLEDPNGYSSPSLQVVQ